MLLFSSLLSHKPALTFKNTDGIPFMLVGMEHYLTFRMLGTKSLRFTENYTMEEDVINNERKYLDLKKVNNVGRYFLKFPLHLLQPYHQYSK